LSNRPARHELSGFLVSLLLFQMDVVSTCMCGSGCLRSTAMKEGRKESYIHAAELFDFVSSLSYLHLRVQCTCTCTCICPLLLLLASPPVYLCRVGNGSMDPWIHAWHHAPLPPPPPPPFSLVDARSVGRPVGRHIWLCSAFVGIGVERERRERERRADVRRSRVRVMY
jgi:hypothetical protein